jgi:hypothetical protein
VDEKIEQQAELVEWWRTSVTPRKNLNRYSQDNSALNCLSMAKAERLTEITQVQVSRWKKRLKDIPQYRAFLYGPAYR